MSSFKLLMVYDTSQKAEAQFNHCVRDAQATQRTDCTFYHANREFDLGAMRVIMCGMDERERLLGLEVTGVYFDKESMFSGADVNMLQTRIRGSV